MPDTMRPGASAGGPRWAQRTLKGLFWVIVGVLGITTLNGYAASGFTRVPNALNQIFGSMISPIPKAPAGYTAATPAMVIQDMQTGKDSLLGQNVAIYGRVLPWSENSGLSTGVVNEQKGQMGSVHDIKSRPGTFVLALFPDPEEHPEMTAPMTITIRVGEDWQNNHQGIQGQWVQVLGAVVAYNPGGASPTPEIQSSKVIPIPEPFDIYDHNIPMPKPGADDD